MSPYRDPETGQFRSDSGDDWTDLKTVFGGLGFGIPAADLAGGATSQNVFGDEAELINFTPVLDNDEVFQVRHLQGYAWLSLPTTATAEGSAIAEFAIGDDFGVWPPAAAHTPPGPLTSTTDREEGIADVNHFQEHDNQFLHTTSIYAEPSHSDSVNGLAAGGDSGRHDWESHFGPSGPAYDRDDELVAPTSIHVDNVSDHAVNFAVGVLLRGRVVEV